MSQSKNKELHDQFFTKPEIVKKYIHPHIDPNAFIVEPAAGNGDLINELDNICIAYDIDPKHNWIQQLDFLTFDRKLYLENMLECKYHVLMNPPFSGSLVKQFFNKAAEFADKIYIIAPRSIRKKTAQNKLDRSFHLIHDEVLPVKAFYTPSDGKDKSVKTVFQIWERRDYKRELWILKTKLSSKTPDFIFVGKLEPCDYVIRRMGKVGELITNPTREEIDIHHPIKCNIDKNLLEKRFKDINYKFIELGQNVLTQMWQISKNEIIEIYEAEYNKPDFEFVKETDKWDFAIKGTRWNAGSIILKDPVMRDYCIKMNKNIIDRFIEIYPQLNEQAQNECVAPRLYKHEIIEIYEAEYNKPDLNL
jgi:hypothetical protein